jgi:methyl-accepting chemotaxis protein
MLSWFANLRVSSKVLVAPGFMILVLIGVGLFAWNAQRTGQANLTAIMTGPVRQAATVADFNNSTWTMQVLLYRLMATAANESDAKKIKALSDDAGKMLGVMTNKLKVLDDPAFDNAEIGEMLTKLKTVVATYVKQANNVIDMADGDAGTALTLMTSASRSFATMSKLTGDLTAASRESRDRKVAFNDAALDQQQLLLLIVVLGAVVVGCLASFVIGRGISRPIAALVPELNKLAEGDFNVSLPGHGRRDEVGQIASAIELVAERVGSIIGNIRASANEVTNASAEISTSTTDLSQRTEEQAASLEQTSASMEAMTTTVKKNAENATQASELASGTRDVADRGGRVVAKTVEAMAKIAESSRKISDIIGVIDEIARQTNLLALNAAVEAARAGEGGRGFAVVASEVRSLAQRSSQAAKDIKDLITNSNIQVKDGVNLVNEAGQSLTEIVESIKKVTAVVTEIANASILQSTGIAEINKALAQMDEVTQQNSALVEENAATSKTLEGQAKSMDDRVAFFRLRAAPLEAKAVEALPVAAARPKAAPHVRTASPKSNLASHRGSSGRQQAGLATALKADPDWKEF